MKTFKEFFICETTLSMSELLKYDYRIPVFRKKIQDGTVFLTSTGEVTIKNTPSNMKILDDIESNKIDNKNIQFEIIGGTIGLNKLLKTKEFGGQAGQTSGDETIKGDKTSLQEVGVLVILDALLENSSFSKDDLLAYKASSRMNTDTDIHSVLLFLKDDKSWFNACMNSAQAILSKFGAKLSSYEIHHGSALFKKIREHGKKLSNLNFDKWNPSDVYFISKYPDFSINDIIEWNSHIFNEDQFIIGISLKKSDDAALHGSIALGVIMKRFGLSSSTPLQIKDKKLTEKDINTLLKHLNSTNSNIKAKSNCMLTTEKKSISDSLRNAELESDNWGKSIPIILDFMSQLNENWEMVLKHMIFSAMSVDVLSCTHWKTSGSGIKIIPEFAPTYNDISIDVLVYKFNGDTDLVINFTYFGKQMKAQMRSKGSLPQLNIISKSAKDTGIPLNSIQQ